MNGTAKLFTHGRSQAVRLPKEFRFEGTEVRVTKVGDKVIREPMDSGAMPWALLEQTVDSAFMPDGREQPAVQAALVMFEH